MLGSFVVCELQHRGLGLRVLARPQSAEVEREFGAELAFGDVAIQQLAPKATAGLPTVTLLIGQLG